MYRILLIAVVLTTLVFSIANGATILTVEKVRQLALEYNRQFQIAKKELDRSRGEIISARAGALPKIDLNGRYTRNMVKREMLLPGEIFNKDGFIKVPISQNNDFDLSLSLTQPLYSGGKVGSAYSIAKIYEKFSKEKVKEIRAAIIFGAEAMFYEAILAESNLEVLKSAYEQMSYNLEVVEKHYFQGMVSEYEHLRARVEKLNLEPQLIGAESAVNIARKSLKSFLGLPLDEEITLFADYSDPSTIVALPLLDSLIAVALAKRPEIVQADLQKRGYEKAVRIARGDWLYPSLDFNTTYQLAASSDQFTINDKNLIQSWTASIFLTSPLFDGGRTIGEVRKARTDYYQARLREEQTRDDIRLEVERVYDDLRLAGRALDLQKETIAHAEEGIRIANLRYQSGIGTQLEVLSSQTALTDARSNLARAMYNFRLANASLKKATGHDIN